MITILVGLIQLFGVLGVVLLGMAMIGSFVQGPSVATQDFALAGFGLIGVAVLLTLLAAVGLVVIAKAKCLLGRPNEG